jgi:hypothetical protein
LAGFSVDISGVNIYFPPLAPEQVLIGLPASPDAAGSGYTNPSIVHAALDDITLRRSFWGQYRLANLNGYARFRGLMTWSINWDVKANDAFSIAHRGYLDMLDLSTDAVETRTNENIPRGFAVGQNYPNPFNPTTSIEYRISRIENVKLSVYDILGREVAVLVNERKEPGSHTVMWDARGMASGVYVYRLTAGSSVQSREMILVK